MSRILHVDGAAGISGDMSLGALVDLGVRLDDLRSGLQALDLPGWSLHSEIVDAHGLRATKVHVTIEGDRDHGGHDPGGHHHDHDHEHGGDDHGHAHRGWTEIERLVTAADIPERARRRALSAFRNLCEAEAALHGIPIERVQLHEVGAVDAIVDVVGACLGLELLDVSRVSCSPPELGGGTVRCQHGVFPVPAPATLRLLQGRPVRSTVPDAEMTTPTGAALLATLSEHWGTMPAMTVERVGYGAGTRTLPDRPNVVRFVLGREASGQGHAAEHLVLEADLDDASPELLAAFVDRARALGAADVTQAPLVMKKGRAGVRLTILCTDATRETLVDALFAETTTIGCRWHAATRAECLREVVGVETAYGPIRVKLATWKGRVVHAKPEHDDCLAAAVRHGVPLKTVVAAASAAATPHTESRR